MKERPILFSGPMVKAILDGRKTQTRRLMKPQPIATRASTLEWRPKGSKFIEVIGAWAPAYVWNVSLNPMDTGAGSIVDACPYGLPGEKLWVRETFATWPEEAEGEGPGIAYRADDPTFEPITSYWRPSIHMPRWASRITLEITGVRVERLNQITESDAVAEGVGPGYIPNSRGSTSYVGHRPMFVRAWEEIHGEGSWDASPWVWVVEFRRLEARDG